MRAVLHDGGLRRFDAQHETTTFPAEMLWGPARGRMPPPGSRQALTRPNAEGRGIWSGRTSLLMRMGTHVGPLPTGRVGEDDRSCRCLRGHCDGTAAAGYESELDHGLAALHRDPWQRQLNSSLQERAQIQHPKPTMANLADAEISCFRGSAAGKLFISRAGTTGPALGFHAARSPRSRRCRMSPGTVRA